MSRRWRWAGVIALGLGTLAGAWAKVDSIYLAAQTLGVNLYWVPLDPISPDTVGWEALAGPLPEDRWQALTSLAAVARELDSTGWKVYRVKNCSAMGLALLASLGRPVAVLCQWHASLKTKLKVPRPGMSLKEMRHSLVSDHRWEKVERAAIEPAGSGGDFRVRIYFAGRGQSQYDARDPVAGMNRQVAGIDGVLIRIPELSFEEDLNIRRTASAICVVAPSDVTAKDLAAGVEKAMDQRKLSLAYTVPQFEVVSIGAPVRAGAAAVPVPAPAVSDTAAGDRPAGEPDDTAGAAAGATDTVAGPGGGMSADSLPR